MKFKNVAEAFNFYRNSTIGEIEKRAAEIKGIIETDANADVATLNIELDGLSQAKTNVEQRSAAPTAQFNPITGASFETRASKEATEGDVFASTEYRSAFFKNLLGQKLTAFENTAYKRAMDIVETEKRADAFNTVTSAAAVLPTSTLNEVVKKARTMGGLLSVYKLYSVVDI